MPLTLQQLLTPTTEQQALDGLLATLRELGFRTSSWQTGSVQLSLVRAVARMGAQSTTTVAAIAAGGLIGLSSGAWLDLVAAWFGEARVLAKSTVGESTWTNPVSGSPQSIIKGSIVYDRATGHRYQTTTATFSLLAGTSATVGLSALVPGKAGNIPLDSTIALVTSYSGVTVTLKPLAAPNDDEWITTQGTDDEDDDRLTRKLELRWAELTYAVGFRAYEYWALKASDSITRVRVLQNYPTENLVRVVLANADGTATGAEVTEVTDYITADKYAINDVPSVSAADVVSQAITLTPRIRAGTTTAAEVEAAILALVNSIPIGGTRIAGAAAGRLLRDQIIAAVMALPGVTSVGLSVPATDIVLGGTDIIDPVFTVTPEFFVGQE